MTRDELIEAAREFLNASECRLSDVTTVMADFAMEAVRAERERIAKQIQQRDAEWRTTGNGNKFFRDFMLRLASELEKNDD